MQNNFPQTQTSKDKNNHHWVGRFAPSPSGSFHFGTLVAALGSYAIARQQKGKWLLRIEDLDPPREVAGASQQILSTLEGFGFEWDGEVVYQSQRYAIYQQYLQQLQQLDISYPCDCSRRQVRERNQGIYDGYCRERDKQTIADKHAIRVKFNSQHSRFIDQIFGEMIFNRAEDLQDFIVFRRDGLFAYQLAVVVDDILQQVNHVVRGADIVDSVPRQNFLYACFQHPAPEYFHLPLAMDHQGAKLSKRAFSPALHAKDASHWLLLALKHLGQKTPPELQQALPAEILAWTVENWQTDRVTTKERIYRF